MIKGKDRYRNKIIKYRKFKSVFTTTLTTVMLCVLGRSRRRERGKGGGGGGMREEGKEGNCV